jgi:hypothetical protein
MMMMMIDTNTILLLGTAERPEFSHVLSLFTIYLFFIKRRFLSNRLYSVEKNDK